MNPACDELQKRQDETETLLERLREVRQNVTLEL